MEIDRWIDRQTDSQTDRQAGRDRQTERLRDRWMDISMQTYTHTLSHTYTYILTYLHTHIFTYLHTYIHRVLGIHCIIFENCGGYFQKLERKIQELPTGISEKPKIGNIRKQIQAYGKPFSRIFRAHHHAFPRAN